MRDAFSKVGLGLRRMRSEPYADNRPREDKPGEVENTAEPALALNDDSTGSAQQQTQNKVLGPSEKQLMAAQQQGEAGKGKGSEGHEAPAAAAASQPPALMQEDTGHQGTRSPPGL